MNTTSETIVISQNTFKHKYTLFDSESVAVAFWATVAFSGRVDADILFAMDFIKGTDAIL